jgi:hypothetical protein
MISRPTEQDHTSCLKCIAKIEHVPRSDYVAERTIQINIIPFVRTTVFTSDTNVLGIWPLRIKHRPPTIKI